MSKHKRFTPEQKYQIVKEFITRKGELTISDICKKYDMYASQFYQWQEMFFQGALERFKHPPHKKTQEAERRKSERLESELKKKEHVIDGSNTQQTLADGTEL